MVALSSLLAGAEARAYSDECSNPVAAMVPSAGATGVPLDVQLVVTTPDDGCTPLESLTYTLEGPGGEVEITIDAGPSASASSQLATIVPAAPLTANSSYTLTVKGDLETTISFETGDAMAEPLPEVELALTWLSLTYPDIGHEGGGLLHYAEFDIQGLPSDAPPGTTLVVRRPDVERDSLLALPSSDGPLEWHTRAAAGDEVCVEIALRAANGVESAPSPEVCRAGDAEPAEHEGGGGCSFVDVDARSPWALLGLPLLLVRLRRRQP